MQARDDGTWMNIGVDLHSGYVIPPRLRPGIGLRPGGARPELEELLPRLYAALYDSVAAHCRLGFDVVVDVGHHDAHSTPMGILQACARRLAGLPVLFVGVRCPLDVILQRRRDDSSGLYAASAAGAPAPAPVLLWQQAVHEPGLYDLEVDGAGASPMEAAARIAARLTEPPSHPTAFERLAARTADA